MKLLIRARANFQFNFSSTPTQLVTSNAYCYVYQTTEGESVEVNNFNQNCEIAAKCSKFGMQNIPVMNWKKCNYMWSNIFSF